MVLGGIILIITCITLWVARRVLDQRSINAAIRVSQARARSVAFARNVYGPDTKLCHYCLRPIIDCLISPGSHYVHRQDGSHDCITDTYGPRRVAELWEAPKPNGSDTL